MTLISIVKSAPALRRILFSLAAVVVIVSLGVGTAQAQATRTWVSGVGDDANPCSRTAPCKTFAGAISKTAAGGEINCIDPGGFGTVTITKSITIDCGGTFGSILAAGTNGINVNDSASGAPGIIVLNIKNLSINGAVTGLIGVNFTSGLSVHLDNVTIMNFQAGSARGISVSANHNPTLLHVNNSYIWNNALSTNLAAG